jgi:NAD(P)-dependent dehydrogenase (short-subunit alcohol dehydrogenase family)
MRSLFHAKHAIVTGGAGGIGSAIVGELLQRGYTVTACAISETEIEQHKNNQQMANANWQIIDVGNLQSVNEHAERTETLDVLVNCAGITARGPTAFSEESFEQIFDINVHGTMRMCRAFLPHLERSKGSIINFASVMSTFGSGTAPGYAASKGAVAQLTKSLAIAWASKGVRVNAIAPGWIETPMTRDHIKSTDQPFYEKVVARTPMGRWGTPENVARVVPFLCSEDAAFITGVVLAVDGGYMAA